MLCNARYTIILNNIAFVFYVGHISKVSICWKENLFQERHNLFRNERKKKNVPEICPHTNSVMKIRIVNKKT